MRFIRFIFAVCALFATAIVSCAAATGSGQGLDIRVEGDWDGVTAEAIQKTLYAVAGVLLPHTSGGPAAPIIVTHTTSAPVTLYERGPNGEYLVHLHASGPRWSLYVYEFAHELTHILSNYDRNAGPGNARRNQWLEESLCETASLFVLDRLATAWAQAPESDAAAARAAQLRRFYEMLVAEPHRRLPEGYSFAAWLADNEPGLRDDPYRRKQDDLVARHLLPLFKERPDGWDALRYLNLDATDNQATLPQYLGHWSRNVPAVQKPFVDAILAAMAAR
jgi:hypothetical protein